MPKSMLIDDFSRMLDEQMIWRRKELSDVRQAVRDASVVSKPTLLRAFLPLAYAHWEGFFVHSSAMYLNAIAGRKLLLNALSDHFRSIIFFKRLDALAGTRFPFDEKLALINSIRNVGDKRFSKVPDGLIDSGSNLSYQRARDICLVCNVSPYFLEGSEDFIDIAVLKRRNQIAHGEWASVSLEETVSISNRLLELMSGLKIELDNALLEERFRHPLVV